MILTVKFANIKSVILNNKRLWPLAGVLVMLFSSVAIYSVIPDRQKESPQTPEIVIDISPTITPVITGKFGKVVTSKVTPTTTPAKNESKDNNSQNSSQSNNNNDINPTATRIPTATPTPTNRLSPSITPTIIPKVTTTIASATATPKLSSTLIPTKTPVSTSGTVSYQSQEDGFSVSYSSQRQLHQDTESSGNRYTFVNKLGNFAIHVSPSDKWSWTHPSRQFTSTLLISGKNTFRYDIATQTIIDLQSDENNYTLQCIHNGVESLKTECDQFVSSFQLL